ncbi:hypothetical protein [Aliirhizobium smilacinae]|uniref:Curlin n=1 Tax=Aliirhizobium smilacinae TaxID=1395944 RepID=A0A5C4XQR7_9HYPH|nr:hypothetical protein [Rhizobium smilacinae]TNM65301.1 hypothetical protein FHP24_03205 [Rhizobium smilacinae]
MRALIVFAVFFIAGSSWAEEQQHYQNFEIQRNATGGYTGTLGNQNFDIDTKNGVSGQMGGNRPNVVQERPARTKGNVGATQKSCVVDGNGRAFCR